MIFLQCDLATLAKLQPASRVRRYAMEYFKPWRKVVSVPRNCSILEAIVREVKGKPIADLILKQPFMVAIDELKSGKTEWFGYYTEFYSTVAREAASYDKTVWLWDAATIVEQQTFNIEMIVYNLAFIRGGSYLQINRGNIQIPLPISISISNKLTLTTKLFIKDQ